MLLSTGCLEHLIKMLLFFSLFMGGLLILSFIGSSLKKDGIAFDLKDYLELADWTGRLIRDDKRGFIDAGTPGILQKLQLDEQTWMETLHAYSKGFHSFVGPEAQLKLLCEKQKRHWIRGINACRKLFNNKPSIPITT